MVQTKEMKNYKTEVTDNNRIEYLHFFGIKYPFIETDGMKIASDELEYAIRNHPNSPEGFELMEEIVLSFKMPTTVPLKSEKVLLNY